MPIRLGAEKNEMRLVDNLSGEEVVLYYRPPTTAERAGYMNGCLVRKGKKMVNQTAEARAKYGRAILAGVRDGDFEVAGDDGAWLPLSSDPQSPAYRKDWKEQVAASAGHLVDTLAYVTFEVACRVADTDAALEGGEEESDTDQD